MYSNSKTQLTRTIVNNNFKLAQRKLCCVWIKCVGGTKKYEIKYTQIKNEVKENKQTNKRDKTNKTNKSEHNNMPIGERRRDGVNSNGLADLLCWREW